jgi:hypothetical protein
MTSDVGILNALDENLSQFGMKNEKKKIHISILLRKIVSNELSTSQPLY